MSVIWFSVSEPRRYFRVPVDYDWPSGDLLLTNFDFAINQVSATVVSEFEIEKSEAVSGAESMSLELEQNTVDDSEPVDSSDVDDVKSGVLGILSDVVNEGIQMSEDILSNLDSEDAVTLAKDLVEEAMEFVSDYVDLDESENSGESLTGLRLRSLLRNGLKEVRFSVQKSGDSTKEK